MNLINKPLIGILPLYDSAKKSTWMYPGYTEGVIAAGGIPIVLSILTKEEDIEELANRLDGFLFTGGQDVDPQFYGEVMLKYIDDVYPPRDKLELRLLESAIGRNKPVLGVCRGIQLFNVAFGGTLYQDIDEQMEREVLLQHDQKTNYEHPVHTVSIKKDTLLHKIVEDDEMRVNSMHHQGIAHLAPALNVAAVSEDGLIESVEIGNIRFGLAVQWHPEFLWEKDNGNLRIFCAFVRAAREGMLGKNHLENESEAECRKGT